MSSLNGNIISGRELAQTIYHQIKQDAIELLQVSGIIPKLVVVQIGDDPASAVYIRMKQKAASDVGIDFIHRKLPTGISQADLLAEIQALNLDPLVHGIIVQLPLPRHLPERLVADAVLPAKDVDGFHVSNVGALARGDPPLFLPCTPRGILCILDAIRQRDASFELRGKKAVVLGRSNIVGKPVAQMLLQRDCTVEICHSRTLSVEHAVRSADIVVVAIGKPHFLPAAWVKPGAVVIDVGINPVASDHSTNKIVGDVHPDVAAVAKYITPVPGGVGPMTVAMLMLNTLESAQRLIATKN